MSETGSCSDKPASRLYPEQLRRFADDVVRTIVQRPLLQRSQSQNQAMHAIRPIHYVRKPRMEILLAIEELQAV